MDVNVKFLGGAGTVTGSKYLLEAGETRILVDCGLFQGKKELRERNWEPFPVPVNTLTAVVLTHAHIDHSGYLPRLVREGYKGPVYCTGATADLLEVLLIDSARLQEEEALYAFKKGYSKHYPPQPLFNTLDAERALLLLQPAGFKQQVSINDTWSVTFINAGHILGAASVVLTIKGREGKKTITFSGDIGRYGDPVLHDPVTPKTSDVLFIESTYGNRNIDRDIEGPLARIIQQAMDRGGCLLIPAFAIGRTQKLLFYLHRLMQQGQIPEIPVYIDSPMAIEATHIYRQNDAYHKLNRKDEEIFGFRQFHYYRGRDQSQQINPIKSGAIIISASGMCTGGRILHHLYNRLPRPDDTLLFAGYQAKGTRGDRIMQGEKAVKIFGQMVPVNCHIELLNGLSAHADQKELLRWLSAHEKLPEMVFVVHGEEDNANALAVAIRSKGAHNAYVPNYLESFRLFSV